MFDFRLFPGTNFNRINLDWIFSKLKELQEGQSTVTEAAEEATAAAEEATAAASAATQAASDAIEAIETVTETAEDAQTRARAAELTAARAESNANTAISDAADASAAATSAGTAAAAAQQTADNAGTAAAAAQQTADNAGTAAATAQSAAAAAQSAANINAALIAALGTPHTWTNPQNSGETWVWWEIGKLRIAFGQNYLSYTPSSATGSLYRTESAVVYGNVPFAFTSGEAAVSLSQLQWAANPGIDETNRQLTAYFLSAVQTARTPLAHFVFVGLAP